MSEDGSAGRARTEALAQTGLDASADPVFDRFAAMVRAVLDVPVALVSLVDPRRQYFPGAAGLAEPWSRNRETPLSHSFCQQVVARAQPLVVVDARDDPRVRDNPAIEDLGVVAYAGMPLTDGDGNVLGSLCAIDHEPRVWTGHELDLLADLATACSDSLRLRIAERHAELARVTAAGLTERLRVAFERSQVLLHASVALTATATVADVIATVEQLVDDAIDPADISIIQVGARRRPALITTTDLPAGMADRWAARLAGTVTAQSAATLVLPDRPAIVAAFPTAAADLDRVGWHAVACAPLRDRQDVLGVLAFAWKQPHAVDVDEQALISTLAGYVAQALHRATHLDEQRSAAATLQRALLTPLPRLDGLHLAARYLPAHDGDHIGGDWYDVIPLHGERVALVIGDVSGHSLQAAAAMSELRSMLRGFLIDRDESPSASLARLDKATWALGAPTFATVLVAHLEPAATGGHTLRWSNAGHPAPTLLDRDGTPTLLPGNDAMLGIIQNVRRHDHTVHLPPGAGLLLHTDGLIETRTSSIDAGFARVHALLAQHPGAAAEDLADLLLTLTATTTREDDIAILIVGTQ